jgi:hypothetical protein
MDEHVHHRRRPSACSLPVIRGARWFGAEHKSFVLRVEQPLTFEEMVAALYGTVEADDIATDEDVCGSVAVTLVLEGLTALERRARRIRRDEEHGTLASPAFLAICRQRVTALLETLKTP